MTKCYFEWDITKATGNRRKHGISFEEAAHVFNDPHHITVQDRIVDGEARWQTFGIVGNCLLLIVAHTIWEEDENGEDVEIIRIISAREVTRKERRWYENEAR